MSLREFARHLGVSDRMVSKWEAGGDRIHPRPINQEALDTSLAKCSEEVQSRFVLLLDPGRDQATPSGDLGLPRPAVERDLRTAPFIAWLADNSDATFQSLYLAVSVAVAQLEADPPSVRYSRDQSRRGVTRDELARAVARYYGEPASGGMLYRARVGGADVLLSMLTRPEWLDTAIQLGGEHEAVRYIPSGPSRPRGLGREAVTAAVQRLAGVEVNGTVMVDNPLYRLLDVDLGRGALSATFTTVPFADHALTTELTEGELLTAIAGSTDRLPLRDTYLPTTDATLDLDGRACVGGTVSVLAIARTRARVRDYVLFTQERSQTVLNLAGALAVLPKGFHQPTGEAADEVRLWATLQREFEEELLGRRELEQIATPERRHVDLLHARNRTDPMAWLLDRPGSYRAECTGFGYNLVTGNYEFACLILIEDDGWWDRFGHRLESNWEAERVNRHSSLDTGGLHALVADRRWGNESLFSLLQGLRRLDEVGDPDRLAIPTIELDP